MLHVYNICIYKCSILNRQQAEEAFSELEERYKHLENKSNQLCELAEKNKDFTIIGTKQIFVIVINFGQEN